MLYEHALKRTLITQEITHNDKQNNVIQHDHIKKWKGRVSDWLKLEASLLQAKPGLTPTLFAPQLPNLENKWHWFLSTFTTKENVRALTKRVK